MDVFGYCIYGFFLISCLKNVLHILILCNAKYKFV